MVDSRYCALAEFSGVVLEVITVSYYNAEKRLQNVERFHRGIREFDTQLWEVDDITWGDLQMDQVFLRVNYTNSFIGEQALYHRMHLLDLGNDQKMAGKLEEKFSGGCCPVHGKTV